LSVILLFSGGSGRISMELSKAYPNMKITMLDLPPVVQIAQKFFPHNTTDGRVQFKVGQYMYLIPPIYCFNLNVLLKVVLH